MSTPTSQGATVSFGGASLGKLTSVKCQPGTAVFAQFVAAGASMLGSGENARVVKESTCIAVDPGSLDVTLFGCPPYTVSNIGDKNTVTFSFDGGSLSAPAHLEKFDVTGNVGQFLVGTATFRLSGPLS